MNVLFICNGNVARSQEAAIFFNDASKLNYAQSAGINVKEGKPIDPLVVSVMHELGYSMQDCYRKYADDKLAEEANLIVSFKPYNELPPSMQNHINVRYWEVADPQHRPIDFHREVRDNIQLKVNELVNEIG
jgi:protein-tyrosine-phosphatase